jgi:hypothetical protein
MCIVKDGKIGKNSNHPFRIELMKYSACLDDEGNIVNLPNIGGLLDQDSDDIDIILHIQQAIRSNIKTKLESQPRTG